MKTLERLRVVSWNVAGFRTVNSLEQFDYGEENVAYFADNIKPLNPHVVFLQEAHTSKNGTRVLSKELAERLAMPHVQNTVVSPSHIDEGYDLGQAILSTRPIENYAEQTYPYPSFPLYWEDDREAERHNKILQKGEIEEITIANTQMLPISLWSNAEGRNYSYAEKEARELAKEIEEMLLTLSLPLIFAGDFNYNNPQEIYPRLIEEKMLTDALPDEVNRPHASERLTPNHIYYSADFICVSSGVVKTQTDHYLTVAEFEKR